MKKLGFALVAAVLAISCGGTSTGPSAVTPTPTPAVQTPAPAPVVIQHANIHPVTDTLTFGCFTGLCTSLTFPIVNDGPGCATNVTVTTRAYGSDGNGIQLGVDIPMGMSGTSLHAHLFKVGEVVQLVNVSSFNDVRSAHTAFKSSATWTDVACQ
jgi:hypothetical protein